MKLQKLKEMTERYYNECYQRHLDRLCLMFKNKELDDLPMVYSKTKGNVSSFLDYLTHCEIGYERCEEVCGRIDGEIPRDVMQLGLNLREVLRSNIPTQFYTFMNHNASHKVNKHYLVSPAEFQTLKEKLIEYVTCVMEFTTGQEVLIEGGVFLEFMNELDAIMKMDGSKNDNDLIMSFFVGAIAEMQYVELGTNHYGIDLYVGKDLSNDLSEELLRKAIHNYNNIKTELTNILTICKMKCVRHVVPDDSNFMKDLSKTLYMDVGNELGVLKLVGDDSVSTAGISLGKLCNLLNVDFRAQVFVGGVGSGKDVTKLIELKEELKNLQEVTLEKSIQALTGECDKYSYRNIYKKCIEIDKRVIEVLYPVIDLITFLTYVKDRHYNGCHLDIKSPKMKLGELSCFDFIELLNIDMKIVKNCSELLKGRTEPFSEYFDFYLRYELLLNTLVKKYNDENYRKSVYEAYHLLGNTTKELVRSVWNLHDNCSEYREKMKYIATLDRRKDEILETL